MKKITGIPQPKKRKKRKDSDGVEPDGTLDFSRFFYDPKKKRRYKQEAAN